MDINDIKLELIQKILRIQDEVLINEIYTKVKKILEDDYQISEENDTINESTMTYTKEKELIVAYTVDGEALSLEQYNKRLLKAEEQFKNGEIISQEDLEKESETW